VRASSPVRGAGVPAVAVADASPSGRLAWYLWGACAAMILFALVLGAITPGFLIPPERPGPILATSTALLSLACPTVGALIVSRLPANPIGWLFCGIGLLHGARRLAAAYADHALLVRPYLPGGEFAAWVSTWLGFPALMAAGVFLALLFPDGRLGSRPRRVVAWSAAVGAAAVCLADAIRPGPLTAYYYANNPFGAARAGWLARAAEASGSAGGVMLSAACAASAVLVVFRLRGSLGDERLRLGWFAYATVPALLGASVMILDRAIRGFSLLFFDVPIRPALQLAGQLGLFVREERALGPLAELRLETNFELLAVLTLFTVPVFTGVAVLRYRLYDIDLVINRTLLYGALSVSVVALYVGLVAGFGALFQAGTRSNLLLSLVVTGLIAVLFQPLSARLQRGVDRLMYGQRRDPYGALSRLGERLETTLAPEAVLPTVVETVAQAMKSPHAAIVLAGEDGPETVAAHGRPAGEPIAVPLVHGDERLGHLLASPPSPEERFSPADHRLLRDLARQAGAAVHAVGLTRDLRRSRERLVAAREEERRRLRRDLHDGLGPTLAGLTFGLEAARRMVDERPDAAGELLSRLEDQAQEAIVNVRRLVHGLRPPALDDLGLVAAIRQQAEAYGMAEETAADDRGHRPVLSVEGQEPFPALPAATEVALYRIAQEAITNVAKHSGAGSCRVSLRLPGDGALELEVSDDGRGIGAGAGSGMGLVSMRERAEELGGTCEVSTPPGGGTRVVARLPLEDARRASDGEGGRDGSRA
jgi:signal transduction histidine kinase